MHAVKCSWIGQTFALAKGNESEGRKSRIRRSKEERKAMVESFIKKYQNSNNGNFPSLNLTHKEVGGSFYTVREIVREIIQENRVLGPAKFAVEEQNTDKFMEHLQLGSDSAESQNALSLVPTEASVLGNRREVNSEGIIILSERGNEHLRVDNGCTINGIHVDVQIKEPEELTHVESWVSESPSEAKNGGDELVETSADVTQEMDVMVETFPLRQATKPTENVIPSSTRESDFTESSEEKEIADTELEAINQSNVINGNTSIYKPGLAVTDENPAENCEKGFASEKGPRLLDSKVAENLADTLLEGSMKSDTSECASDDSQDVRVAEDKARHNDIVLEDSEQGWEIAATKASYTPIGSHVKTQEANDVGANQCKGIADKESSPTLDRINLQSWERGAKSSAKPVTNPIWAVLRTVVDAFVKFWSE